MPKPVDTLDPASPVKPPKGALGIDILSGLNKQKNSLSPVQIPEKPKPFDISQILGQKKLKKTANLPPPPPIELTDAEKNALELRDAVKKRGLHTADDVEGASGTANKNTEQVPPSVITPDTNDPIKKRMQFIGEINGTIQTSTDSFSNDKQGKMIFHDFITVWCSIVQRVLSQNNPDSNAILKLYDECTNSTKSKSIDSIIDLIEDFEKQYSTRPHVKEIFDFCHKKNPDKRQTVRKSAYKPKPMLSALLATMHCCLFTNEIGMGLKKPRKTRRKKVVGRGATSLQMSPKRYVDINDKYCVDMQMLESQNILKVKYLSNRFCLPHFSPIDVSNDLRDVVIDTINGQFNQRLYDKLSIIDKRLFGRFVNSVHIQLQLPPVDDVDFQSRFEIVQGEIESGNDSPEVKREYKRLLTLAYHEKIISHRKLLELLIQI